MKKFLLPLALITIIALSLIAINTQKNRPIFLQDIVNNAASVNNNYEACVHLTSNNWTAQTGGSGPFAQTQTLTFDPNGNFDFITNAQGTTGDYNGLWLLTKNLGDNKFEFKTSVKTATLSETKTFQVSFLNDSAIKIPELSDSIFQKEDKLNVNPNPTTCGLDNILK